MAAATRKRLHRDTRRTHILEAAEKLLARRGLAGFSLEAVAREARVAATLPRHYFGSSRDLLKAATEDVLKQVEAILLPDGGSSLAQRFDDYLALIRKNPWAHAIWMRSAELHPGLGALVRKARGRMAESMYRQPAKALTKEQQFDARGRIGYVEAAVAEWIERGMADTDAVAAVLVEAVRVRR